MIANSGAVTVEGQRLSNKISISDGLLDVIVFRSADFGSLLSVTTSVLMNREAVEGPELQHWQVREASVSASPAQTVSIDGEICEVESVSARILPDAVNVVVPVE
jgi:diacylglycerol kinase family enzyme